MQAITFEEFVAQVRAIYPDLVDRCIDISIQSRSVYSPTRRFYYLWVDDIYICYDSIVATPWHIESRQGVFGTGFSLEEACTNEHDNYQAWLEYQAMLDETD
jgi:hypothetical protein